MRIRRFFALLLLTSCGLMAQTLGQSTTPPLSYHFSVTAASGTIGPFPTGGSSSCSATFTSVGGASVTVQGSSDSVAGGTYTTIATFSPSANYVWSGSVAAYPVGIQLPYTSLAGTLAGTLTCANSVGYIPNNAPPGVTFNSGSAGQQACVYNIGQTVVAFQLVGTTDKIDATALGGQSTNADSAVIVDKNGVKQSQPLTPTNGQNYRILTQGAQTVCIQPDASWTTGNATAYIWSNAGGEAFVPPTPIAYPSWQPTASPYPWTTCTPPPGGFGPGLCTVDQHASVPQVTPFVTPTASLPPLLPGLNVQIYWTGSAWAPVTNTSPLPVTSPSPYATSSPYPNGPTGALCHVVSGSGCQVPIACPSFAAIGQTTGGSTTANTVLGGSINAGQVMYVCGWSIHAVASSSPAAVFKYTTASSGSSCSGSTNATAAFPFPSAAVVGSENPWVQWTVGGQIGALIQSSPGQLLCLGNIGTNPFTWATVWYTIL